MDERIPVNSNSEEPKKNWFSNHKLVGYGIFVLALAGIVGIIFYVNPSIIKTKINSDNQQNFTTDNLKTKSFTVIKDFPFYAQNAINFDSEDKNIIWLSFNGAIVKYNLQNDTWDSVLTGVKGLDNSPWTLVRKGNDIYFSLFQGGFEKINLLTGQHKNYTSLDGLANNGNIVVYDDPGTDDIWIATFNGLSRFNSKIEKFTNYTTELGSGTAWGINNVVVNKNFVWVNISSNAYFKGGIARYDKTSNSWKVWGPPDFGGQQYVHISYGMDASNDVAVVEVGTTGNSTGNKIMEYNPKTDKWAEIFKRKTTSTIYQNFTYIGDKIYFIDESKVMYYDRSLGKVFTTTLAGQPNSNATIIRDFSSERLIFWDRSDHGTLYDLKTNQIKKFKLDQPTKFLDKLITADEKRAIFTNGQDLVVHEFSTNKDKIINTSQQINEFYEGKIIGDYLLTISPAFQEMGDFTPGQLILINLKNYSVERNLVVKDFYFDSAFVGKDVSEIFIGTRSYNNQNNSPTTLDSIEKYDFSNNSFSPQELSRIDLKTLNQVLSTGIPMALSKNGGNNAEVPFNPIHNGQIKIGILYNGISDTKTFDLPSKGVDAWYEQEETSVYAVEFDYTNPDYLWIGTNQGLLLYNLASQKEQIFYEADGLISNSVKKIISLSNGLVLEDETGTYLYRVNYGQPVH